MAQKALIIFVAGLLFVSNCALAWSEEPFRFGVLTDLSGPSAENGVNCMAGVSVAGSDRKPDAKTIEFVFGDHRGEAKSGILEFKKVVEIDKVRGVMSNRSQVVMPLISRSNQETIPLFGVAGHAELISKSKYAVRFFPSVEQEARALGAVIKKLGRKKIAVITLEDEWTVSLSEAFRASVAADPGVKIVVDDTLANPSSPESLQEAARVRSTGADAVFLNLGYGSVGVFVKRLREQGFKGEILSNYWIAAKAEVASAGIQAAEGALFIETNTDKPKFKEAFARFAPGKRPTALAYSCYSGATAMFALRDKLPDDATRSTIADALIKLDSVALLDETLPIRRREIIFDIGPKVIRDGAVVPWESTVVETSAADH